MKKLLFLLVILGWSFILKAQNNVSVQAGTFYTVIKVTSDGNNLLKADETKGFSFITKVNGEFSVGNVLSLNAGISYLDNRFGFRGSWPPPAGQPNYGNASVQRDYKVKSFEFPLSLKVRIGGENVKFHMATGISAGLPFKGSVVVSGYYHYSIYNYSETVRIYETVQLQRLANEYEPEEIKDDRSAISKVNLDLIGGLGISVKAGNCRIMVEGNYMHGLTDWIPDVNGVSATPDYSVKTWRMSLTAGVAFPF